MSVGGDRSGEPKIARVGHPPEPAVSLNRDELAALLRVLGETKVFVADRWSGGAEVNAVMLKLRRAAVSPTAK